jgi:hypothetical protein
VRRLVAVVLVALVAAPAALAWRAPTFNERFEIIHSLPGFYHQPCIRTQIKVSTVDPHYAAVYFHFVNVKQKGCSPFDGQVLMKRVTATGWKKIAEGSSWPCKAGLKGVSARIVRDLFGGCFP